jgi:GTP cyclohydrolase IA
MLQLPKPPDLDNAARLASAMMANIWPDLQGYGEHIEETPERFVKMLSEMTTRPDIKWKTFASGSDEMVVVRDIPFASLCAHHLVPFVGVAHIGYVPNGCICGLSKLARVVHHYAAGLNVQEDLTTEIANYLNGALAWDDNPEGPDSDWHHPIGVAVVMEAEHYCMTLRGIKVPGTKTTTSKMLGCFADHSRQARAEFLALVNR